MLKSEWTPIFAAFLLMLAPLGCLDPPSVDLGEDPSGNESAGAESTGSETAQTRTGPNSLDEFLTEHRQAGCEWLYTCSGSTTSVQDCTEFEIENRAYINAYPDCKAAMESWYISHRAELNFCLVQIPSLSCDLATIYDLCPPHISNLFSLCDA